MNGVFKLNAIRFAFCVAFPAMFSVPALAAEPFPALPVTLSTSVTPNIMLYIDTSGSMVQDANNQWIDLKYTYNKTTCSWWGGCVTSSVTASRCTINDNTWADCLNNDTNAYRTVIDSPGTPPSADGTTPASPSYNTKMNIAKRVSKNLVEKNTNLRFGLFSFQNDMNAKTAIGGTERSQAGVLRADIAGMSDVNNMKTLETAIDALNGRTSTPLGEGLLEVTQYYSGGPSLFGVRTGNYTSPIQYRCQKNFTIVITDGVANDDQNLPGSGLKGDDGHAVNPVIAYTARDSAGKAVSRNFSVCMKADTVTDAYTVNCPATLEAGTTTRTFTAGNPITNLPSAIRDVAMYGKLADLRIGGVDDEQKDFDDPKFARQNMNTYTIGFSVANPVLPAAAFVGGGKDYSVNDEVSLAASLNNAINSIVAATSNAGGLATTTPVKQSKNKLFQPVFNPDGWSGELRCYDYGGVNYDALGNIISGSCSPNPKANFPSTRTIFSAKWDAVTTPASGAGSFSFLADTATLGKMTSAQKANLGATDSDRMDVIAFLRGVSNAKFRTRTNGLLGDIIDAQPLVVTAPTGVTSDSTYATFQTANSSRNIVFIGANDGMMHAFDTSNMTEIMGYVPAAVYPHLDDLTKTDYGVSGGTDHVYGVNGEVRQGDVKIGSSAAWKTVVVGGLAQGGQGFYALDATSQSTLGSAPMKWEWNDQNDAEMGYSFGAPIIYNVRATASTVTPAVILVNGYENDYDDTATGGKLKPQDTVCNRVVNVGPPVVTKPCNTSALYIVNADTGALIKKLSIPARADGIGGLSSPAGVDFGQDGVLDYVYAGDLAGRLWRFDLTSSDPTKFNVFGTPIFDAGTNQPITLRPVIKPVYTSKGESRGNLILFGTGKLVTEADRKSIATQSFYAVLDDMSDKTTTVGRSDLVQRVINDAVDITVSPTTGYRSGTYRKIEDSSVSLDLTSATESKKGWYIDFPASSERLVSSPILLDYTILFGTGITQTNEKCVTGGKGWVMGLNPLDGGVTKGSSKNEYSFVDIKLDGTSTVDDKLTFSSGLAYASGFATDGIPTELTYVADSSKIVTVDSTGGGLGSAGSVIALQDANLMAVYTGAGGSGATAGNSMGRPSSGDDGGQLIVGKVGSPYVDDVRKNGPGGVTTPPKTKTKIYTIDTTIWREIK